VIHLTIINTCESDLKSRINEALHTDEHFVHIKECLEQEPMGRNCEGYRMTEDGLLMYQDRLYIPNSIKLKRLIMDELHKRPYSWNPGYQKMITTIRKLYYCPGMKKEIANTSPNVLSVNKSRLNTDTLKVYYNQCLFQNGSGKPYQWILSLGC
jgi:hypothetical protein